jgi:formate dehydrogenase maturation protein FdhE
LKQRWPFAAEVLVLYRAVLDVQAPAFHAARAVPPDPAGVAAYVAQRVLPGVIDASAANGPERLAASVAQRFHTANLEQIVAHWLAGDELPAVDRYLARAAAGPVLEALGEAAGQACTGPRDERHCPNCGGAPQVSWVEASAEDLVTPHRFLECSRCAVSWSYPRLTCAGCGETDAPLLIVLGEEAAVGGTTPGQVVPGVAGDRPRISRDAGSRFPHIRIDGCRTCSHYVLNIDLPREPGAVPEVDELAAIPLDLYARERGMTKIQPNLMGC